MLSNCKIVLDHKLNHGGMSVRSYGIVNTSACLQIMLSLISSYPKNYGILQLLPKENQNRWREIRKGSTKCIKKTILRRRNGLPASSKWENMPNSFQSIRLETCKQQGRDIKKKELKSRCFASKGSRPRAGIRYFRR